MSRIYLGKVFLQTEMQMTKQQQKEQQQQNKTNKQTKKCFEIFFIERGSLEFHFLQVI